MKKASVTELLNLLNKPALLSWANKIGLQGISLKDYKNKKFKNGISLHKQFEDYVLEGIIPDNNILKNNIDHFLSDKEILAVEKNIECEWFVGRVDFVFKKGEKIYICDFKSNKNRIYIEDELQLTAYSMCIDFDELCIVDLPTFKIFEISKKNINENISILKSLSSIYQITREYHV